MGSPPYFYRDFKDAVRASSQTMHYWMDVANDPNTGCSECTLVYQCTHHDTKENESMKRCLVCLGEDIDRTGLHYFSGCVIHVPYKCPDCRLMAALQREEDSEKQAKAQTALVEVPKPSEVHRRGTVTQQWEMSDLASNSRLANEAKEQKGLQAEEMERRERDAVQAVCRERWLRWGRPVRKE